MKLLPALLALAAASAGASEPVLVATANTGARVELFN